MASSHVLSYSFIIQILCVCVLLLNSQNSTASTTVVYQTKDNKHIAPQGIFKNSSGIPLSYNSSAQSGKLVFDGDLFEIDNYAFHNCLNVTSLELPSSVTKIGYAVFSNFNQLLLPIANNTIFARLPIDHQGEYVIKIGIKEIASFAFKNCTRLTGVSIPESVINIGESAFASCTNLKGITIPNNVKSIGKCAFWNCSGLMAIFVGNTPISIDSSTFENVDKKLCSLYVPKGCVNIYKSTDFWKDFENIIEINPSNYSLKTNILKLSDENRYLTFNIEHQAELQNVEFTLIMPEGLSSNESQNLTGTVNRDNIEPLALNTNCESGIYSVKLTNIILTDIGGNKHHVEDFVTNVFVGNTKAPTENGVVSFAGDYSTPEAFALLNEAIPVANVIDLTNVSSVPKDSTIRVANVNALIKTSVDLELKNDHNVVINSTCENLVVDDSDAFGTDEEFTAARVSYERAMKSTWGTVCMPFEVTSNNDVQFYTNGSVVNGVLSLEKADVVSAGQPAIFKRITNENLSISRNGSLTIAINPSENETSTQEIKLFGTYTKQVFTEGELYYIAQDKFWLKSEGNTLTVNPYRAWFTIDSSNNANNRSLTIEEESNEAASIKALNAMFDGSATYFDEQGRQISDLQSGMNIVKTPDGTIKKVLLK